jgi:hypothetical protein
LIAAIITGTATGQSGVWLAARILGNLGAPIVQADIASISYTVMDLTTATQIASGTFTVANVVYNSLQQTDARWSVDSQYSPNPIDRSWGYNFAATVPAADFASLFDTDFMDTVRSHRVQITVTFVPVVGEQFRQAWQFNPIPSW